MCVSRAAQRRARVRRVAVRHAQQQAHAIWVKVDPEQKTGFSYSRGALLQLRPRPVQLILEDLIPIQAEVPPDQSCCDALSECMQRVDILVGEMQDMLAESWCLQSVCACDDEAAEFSAADMLDIVDTILVGFAQSCGCKAATFTKACAHLCLPFFVPDSLHSIKFSKLAVETLLSDLHATCLETWRAVEAEVADWMSMRAQPFTMKRYKLSHYHKFVNSR